MLRREGRDPAESEIISGHADRIADGIDPGIKDADDIACPGFRDDVAVIRHHLLRLGESGFLLSLYMPDFHIRIKVPGDDPHEGDPVSVILIHIRLDLEDEGGEIILLRIDQSRVGHARQGGGRHFQEMLQEGLHTEVRQRRAEEDG